MHTYSLFALCVCVDRQQMDSHGVHPNQCNHYVTMLLICIFGVGEITFQSLIISKNISKTISYQSCHVDVYVCLCVYFCVYFCVS